MIELLAPIGSALWLGILTSISPCPLATNIVAISYIGQRIEHPRAALWTGLLYTLGRMLAYTVLAILLVTGLQSIPQVSNLLQKYMNKILGPILILVGMVLLDLITLNLSGGGMSDRTKERIDSMGIWGGGVLGVIFALSFCPTSAALFFGSLIPLSVKLSSSVALPAIYGAGTGLPVFAFAICIVLGAQTVARAFERITQFEWWARRLTGAIFVLVGVYFSLAFIFRVL